ncbi:uncharacterized protein LOC135367894 isoform X2 [Ornithodoros turicata]|uniref:uncharacterized protein LOC135367894 isoform X2 n=1 Tax=Ornithodoros turicata TaxID=34597 RepID=UPI00313877F1
MAHVVLESDFAVENILQFVDVEDLFACCEVSKAWQEAGLKMIRNKLVSVSVGCVADTDQGAAIPNDDERHICPEMLCSKFTRYRNIAGMAGLRPTLVFLSHDVDLSQNKSVVDSVRRLLPKDSVIVYFKLEVIRTQDGMEDKGHEGIVGEFVFRTDAGLLTPERASAIAKRPMIPPPSSEGGAVFHNLFPGVLVFQALHVTDANFEGRAVTSYFTESTTKRIIQVTSVAIPCTMQSTRLKLFMKRLRDNFGESCNTIAVAFPRDRDEAVPELEAFEVAFPTVPVLANQATEFTVDGQFAPLNRLKLIFLLIKLLE